MGKTKHTILELNGKRYDAQTGRLIAEPVSSAPSRQPARDIKRTTTVSRHVHKTAQRSQTLMRTGVKRPAAPTKMTSSAALAKPEADIRPAQPPTASLTAHSDNQRISRAHKVQRSKLVRKFSDFGAAGPTPKLAAQAATPSIAILPVRPAPQLAARKPLRLKESLIEKGLQNATSHTEKHLVKPAARGRKKRSRLATYGAGALATLLLAGFIGYQNVPNIAMRYAAARSGIAAGLPSYQPAGFALNRRIQYNPGQITLNYSSNADDRAFTITQRESNWNSDTLKTTYVSTKSDQVQTYEDKGRTIYLYGDNNATWVSSGVWYDINGDSQLNSDQLIRIATSM